MDSLTVRSIKPLLSIREAGELLGGSSRSRIYELVKTGEIEGTRLRGRTLVVGASVARLINELPRIAPTQTPRAIKPKGGNRRPPKPVASAAGA